MNIIALRRGTVHAPAGKRTLCKVRIRENWQETDADLTCPACILRIYGAPPAAPVPVVEPVVEPAPSIANLTIAQMLDMLEAHIVDTIYVIAVAPGATVNVPASQLHDWCERRITSRRQHKNKAVKYCFGPGRNNGVPTQGTKV